MRKFLFGAVALAVAVNPLFAQESGQQLNLEQVLRIALGTNEQVAQAEENLQYAELLRRAAWSAFVPDASLRGSFVRNDKKIEFQFGPGEGDGSSDDMGTITFQSLFDYSFMLTVSSPLYRGGFLYKTVEQSGINIGLNENQLDKARLDLLFQVSAAYSSILKAQRELEIKHSALDLANSHLEQARILFKAGEEIRSSVLRAEAQVASAEGELIRAENTLAKAREALRTLVDIKGDFTVQPLAVPSLPAEGPDALVEIGLRNRLETKSLDNQLELNRLEIEKAFGQKLPQVDWAYTYTRQRAGFPTNAFWKLSLNFSLNIYDSGASTILKAQHESERRKLELQRSFLERQIKTEITGAYLDYTTALKGKAASDRQLQAVSKAYEDIERFYKVGEATELDVQDLRKQLIDAEIFNANLSTDEILALFRLRHSMGLPAVEIR